jgi:hypothetical protein
MEREIVFCLCCCCCCWKKEKTFFVVCLGRLDFFETELVDRKE